MTFVLNPIMSNFVFSEVPLVIDIVSFNIVAISAYGIAFATILLDLAFGLCLDGPVFHEGWKYLKK